MPTPLKLMYNSAFVNDLTKALSKYHPQLDKKQLHQHFSTNEWENAELKARVILIAKALRDAIPGTYQETLDVLMPASQEFQTGYLPIFFPEFVSMYGLNEWNASLKALEVFTQSSSAEFAIRPFILQDEKRAMKQMLAWSKNNNVHIRRLSSEGCRPRLPWGMRLHSFVQNPEPVLPILNNLKQDKELYVRKSVANHLNDISKDHPDLVLNIATDWMNKHEHTDWIVKHALRTLLKQGDQRALTLFGTGAGARIGMQAFNLHQKQINIGDKLSFLFSFELQEKLRKDLRIEYAIDYLKSNGTYSRKVFKITERSFDPGIHKFERNQGFQDLTTRKHYSGKHGISIIINGEVLDQLWFELR
jgi:3-methyladenine DNA glycosylase AlkC